MFCAHTDSRCACTLILHCWYYCLDIIQFALSTILKICPCYWVYILISSNCSIVFYRENLLHFIYPVCWTSKPQGPFITGFIFSGYLLHSMQLKSQLHEVNHSCVKTVYFLNCHTLHILVDYFLTLKTLLISLRKT